MELLVLIVKIHINAIVARVGKEPNATGALTTALLLPVGTMALARMVTSPIHALAQLATRAQTVKEILTTVLPTHV